MTETKRSVLSWLLLAAAVAGAAAVAALNFGPRVVYRIPDPTAQHATAGLVAADLAWWNAQEALDAKTAKYPTWLLGYRVEQGVKSSTATVDDFVAGVSTGGRQAFYSSVTVRFGWTGSRWVQQGQLSIQSLGSTPAAYAQFTPVP